jgi:hypothetical protein
VAVAIPETTAEKLAKRGMRENKAAGNYGGIKVIYVFSGV